MKRNIGILMLFTLILAFSTSCADRPPEISNLRIKKECLLKKWQIEIESRIGNTTSSWTNKDENIIFFADSFYVASNDSCLEIFNYITEKGLGGKIINIFLKSHISYTVRPNK